MRGKLRCGFGGKLLQCAKLIFIHDGAWLRLFSNPRPNAVHCRFILIRDRWKLRLILLFIKSKFSKQASKQASRTQRLTAPKPKPKIGKIRPARTAGLRKKLRSMPLNATSTHKPKKQTKKKAKTPPRESTEPIHCHRFTSLNQCNLSAATPPPNLPASANSRINLTVSISASR